MKFLIWFILSLSLYGFAVQTKADKQSPYSIVAIGEISAQTIAEIKQQMDQHYHAILSRYKVDTLPPVTIKIWQDRSDFEDAYGTDAQYVQGYVVASDWEIRFFNGRPKLGLGVVHEFTHLVTLAVNSDFNNNPRWLWEATAIYESMRPPVIAIGELKCVSSNRVPSIEQLNNHPFNIYRLGYYLNEFIIATWGYDGLLRLIKHNGDISAALGMSEQAFVAAWQTFLNGKYTLSTTNVSDDC
ncbi:hypothetical protein [Thalassotalea sp. Y01]|uniref:hypothetical protein n=1 Tax=Thalassotalea sp. Y01 TaxID=2729613 RepID=UPI00145DCCED|nr:hypothetical protein [Thalassotalea sp. Y01]NMP16328.1 hypothetical protein [Thalassotalea sp. Y01]